MPIDDYTNTDICTKCRFHNDKQCSGVDSDKIHCYYYLIEMLAHIDVPEPARHGRWIPIEYDSYADGAPVWAKWECSECGHEHSGEEDTLTAFCPDCGSKTDATDTNVGGKGGMTMADIGLKPCPFCGGSVRFDKAYSYFRDSVIYCDDCDMVFTLDDCQASDDEICEAWNRRTDNGFD